MKVNVGGFDRIIRILLGLVALYLGYSTGGTLAYVGYAAGALLLVTGAAGWCGLYTLLGVNTCKKAAGS